MHERERELIAALAEGSLGDEGEARALLEASSEARAEYRFQLDALAALEEASTTEMTEVEKAQLHRDLWTQLRAERAKSRSTAWIYRWSLAAAALFVVVGLATVLGGGVLGGGQAADTFSEISESLRSPAADMATEESDETFSAADEAGEAAPLSADVREYFDREADRLRSDQLARNLASDDGSDPWAKCLEEANVADHRVLTVIEPEENAPVEGRYLAVAPPGEPVGPSTPIRFVDAEACETVHTSP